MSSINWDEIRPKLDAINTRLAPEVRDGLSDDSIDVAHDLMVRLHVENLDQIGNSGEWTDQEEARVELGTIIELALILLGQYSSGEEFASPEQKYMIFGTRYQDGQKSYTFDLGEAAHLASDVEAQQLLASYVTGLVVQGGTATFSKVHNEYRVSMPDGAVEYIKMPVAV